MPKPTLELAAEDVPQFRGVLRQLLVPYYSERRHGHFARDGVASIRTPMLPGTDGQHDLVVAEHRAHRVGTPTESLPQHEDVRADVAVLSAQQFSGAPEAGLYLIPDEEDVVLLAELLRPRKVVRGRNLHAGLALDGLDVETRNSWVLELFLKCGEVVVRHVREARGERTEALVTVRVGGRAHCGNRAAPEIAFREYDLGLVGGHALDHVRPLPAELACGLAGLDSGVHGQHLVVAEKLGHELGERRIDIVVKGPARQSQRGGLLLQGGDNLRVTMALIHS
mmetsp:Transcript_28297/g.78136  ORF Transcript_28297/g.78136 Transcript_28297/m.78136 type:complete len:281 (-) Transcript_28297:323-1165(-)